jgi:hypothetical protein
MSFPGGLHPFWFLNDRLDPAELRRQVAQLAAAGCHGFFLHSRQGLGQPYLSEAYFEAITAACEAAAEHGLTVNLYDEYPYPSGAAGGEVVLGCPELAATHLVQRRWDLDGGPLRLALPRGRVLSAVAFPLTPAGPDWEAGRELRAALGVHLGAESFATTGLTAYNRKRYFADQPTPLLETELPPGRWRVLAAVQALVEHHKYWGAFPDVLNPAAVQRFLELTHERWRARFGPHFGGLVRSIFADEVYPGWSAQLPAAFAEAYGYDLIEHLPALADDGHPGHRRVRADLEALTYDLFCRAFEGPISAWCRRHGLLYAAEKPAWRLAQLNWQDVPGCDVGHTKAGARPDWLQGDIRGNARATVSAAYFYGKPGALCECYHSLGWGATLQDAKLIADGLLLLGIDTLVPHGCFYTTANLRKHDAPPSFFWQMPAWPLFGRLTERIERVLAAFAGSRPDAAILLVEPSPGQPTAADREVYVQLQTALMDARLDFLMVDTDLLTATDPAAEAVTLREVAAPLVIVPPRRYVEPKLADWLARRAAAGRAVLWPAAPFEPEAFLAEVRRFARPTLRLDPAPGVWTTLRRRGEQCLWLVVNTTGEAHDLACAADQPLREERLDGVRDLRGGRLSLAPFQSCLLIAGEPEPAPEVTRLTVPGDGPGTGRPLQSNLLRLARPRLTLGGQSAEVEAVGLAAQLAAGGFAFAPRFEQPFGLSPNLRLPTLELTYELAFGCRFEGEVDLVLEPGSVGGDWRWRLDDGDWHSPEELAPVAHHVAGSLGAPLGRLAAGGHRLVIEARTADLAGGLRNPVYLAGEFAVDLQPDGPWLAPPRPAAAFERYAANGLPYYAGVIEYESHFELPAAPLAGAVEVELTYAAPFQDAAEVAFNDGPWHAVAWEPRRVAVAAEELRPGANRLRTRVCTTLCRSFEGQWFDACRHAYRDVGDED